ncbi:hypothetical protein F885_00682 [Acinetobacter higginsii]|nr:hypothetical protein F885_00682 [Acinetobacter higginsii]
MLKIVLISWIAGIALMGHDFSFAAQTWWIWLTLAAVIFGLGLYKRTLYSESLAYRLLLLCSVSWALFCTGFYYADSALQQRLKLKEIEVQPFEAIIYQKD